jgi:hypothetical protein
VQICKHCRQLFDPAIQIDPLGKWAEDLPCSWHPGELVDLSRTAGPDFNNRDLYRWTCCGASVLSGVKHDDGGARDILPRRSPGCTQSGHVTDPDLTLDVALASELKAVQQRLQQIDARKMLPGSRPGVFISTHCSPTRLIKGCRTTAYPFGEMSRISLSAPLSTATSRQRSRPTSYSWWS